MTDWWPDLLGDSYEQHIIDLGNDPDAEGRAYATLVRRAMSSTPRAAVLYVHGFSDYFFHTPLADFFTDRGIAFYALDLRKCGRSIRPGQTPHYVSDLGLYDRELNEAVRIIASETSAPIIVGAHSTGGLITPLWLDRHRPENVAAQFLNSPWFDLQGPAWTRGIGTRLIRALSVATPKALLPLPDGSTYGDSIHISQHGEWDYELDWKPLSGFGVSVGWLAAIRRGQAQLHRGIDVGVPSLVMRSGRSRFLPQYGEKADSADLVLDVRQIGKWAGCLGNQITVEPIDGARHDVFLSLEPVRKEAYRVLDTWLDEVLGARS